MPRLDFHTAGVRVRLESLDTDVAALVADVGSAMLSDGRQEPDVTVSAVQGGADADTGRAAAHALSLVDRVALSRTHCLAVHAAALAGPSGCVVVPGASGVGKTTLAGAAMQYGLTLVSDEAACFSEPVGTLVPHPRPLGLSWQSRHLLGLAGEDDVRDEQATATALLGETASPDFRGRCVVIALPVRKSGAVAGLEPLSPAEALPTLLASCLNVPPARKGEGWSPEEAWRYLSDLVTQVRLARLVFDSPYAGATLLASTVGVDSSTS